MENYDHKAKIAYLLAKYETKQPEEKWSKEYESARKREYRLKKKIDQAKILGRQLYLTQDQIARVVYIIRKVDNLQRLHRTLSYEEIIFIICYFVKQQDHDDFQSDKYSLCNRFSYIKEQSFRKVLVRISKYTQINH